MPERLLHVWIVFILVGAYASVILLMLSVVVPLRRFTMKGMLLAVSVASVLFGLITWLIGQVR